MTRPLWFKAKRYGWGWYPATWQGWLLTGSFIALMMLDVMRIEFVTSNDADAVLLLIPDMIVLVCALLLICVLTGEKPRWRWGGKDS